VLGPWDSGTKKPAITLDKMLKELEERRMEDLELDMFGYDHDVGYYDYDEDDDLSVGWNWSDQNQEHYIA
jgi:hypothetical protein